MDVCISESKQVTLRSATATALHKLVVSRRQRSTKLGKRIFAVAGRRTWNRLPSNLRLVHNLHNINQF